MPDPEDIDYRPWTTRLAPFVGAVALFGAGFFCLLISVLIGSDEALAAKPWGAAAMLLVACSVGSLVWGIVRR